jgi:hypothetical protein
MYAPTLLSRFQGAFVGATLGTAWGVYSLKHSGADLRHWQQFLQNLDQHLQVPSGAEVDAIAWVTSSLVERDSLDGLAAPPLWQGMTFESQDVLRAALPILLFYHEDEHQLWKALQQLIEILVAQNLLADPQERLWGNLLVVGMTCSLLLQPLESSTLIPTLVNHLQSLSSMVPFPAQPICAELVQSLIQAQSLWQQGSSLSSVVSLLRQPPASAMTEATALAFYCFLTTPTEFSLSLIRATQTQVQSKWIGCLTGILSGVYHGIRLDVSISGFSAHPITSKQLQLATHLFAVWSGVHQSATLLSHPISALQAVSAPKLPCGDSLY